MPGDNVEMVCDLVHDVAAEVGSRYVALLRSIPLTSHATTALLYGKAEKPVSFLCYGAKAPSDCLVQSGLVLSLKLLRERAMANVLDTHA